MTEGNKRKFYSVWVTILEARNLAWSNVKTFVCVEVAGKKKYGSIRGPSDRPFFNEQFVFDVNSTFQELQDTNIIISMFKPYRRALKKKLGRVQMDIGTIWNHKDHQVYHEWLTLSFAGQDKGFLKCDIKILASGEHCKVSPRTPVDTINRDVLLPKTGLGSSNLARYVVRLYRAGDLLRHVHDVRISKQHPAISFATVCFMGCTAKTVKTRYSHDPVWNNQFTFISVFPPPYFRIKLNVNIRGKDIIKQTVSFDDISDDCENGFLPMFGPSSKYSYTSDYKYNGYLLFSIETIAIKAVHKNELKHSVRRAKIRGLDEDKHWILEEFVCFGIVYSASMIENKYSKTNMEITLSVGKSGFGYKINKESNPVTESIRSVELNDNYNRLKINDKKRCIFTTFCVPDARNRLFFSNFLNHIHHNLETILNKIDRNDAINTKIKIMEEALKNLKTECNVKLIPPGITNLDDERARVIKECLDEIVRNTDRILKGRQTFNEMYSFSKNVLTVIKKFIKDPQDSLPGTVLSICSKDKIIYTGFISPEEIIYANEEKYRGFQCGVIQTVLLKHPDKSKFKSELKAKLDIFLWLGLKRHFKSCLNMIPSGYEPFEKSQIREIQFHPVKKHMTKEDKQKMLTFGVPLYIVYNNLIDCICYAYIYQGYFEPYFSNEGFYNSYVKVIVENKSGITQIFKNSLYPVWSETLTIRDVHLYGNIIYFKRKPPTVVLEIWNKRKKSSVLLGSAMSRSYFASENETPTTKLLEWVPVINNSENVGKVLVVLYLIQGDGERMGDGDTGERMPLYIVPVTVTYRLEVLFWGIRGFTAHTSKPFVTIMFADNLISSGSIENISSFPNFNNSPVILDVKLPVLEKYSAPFVIRVMDSKWFGMKHYVGSGVIENVLNFFLISLPTSEEWLSVRQSVIFKPVSYNQLMTFNEDQNESFRNGGFKYILKCLKESLIRILIAVNSPLKFIFKLKSSNYDKLDSDMLIESEEMRAVEASSYDYRKKHFDWWTKYCASKNQIFSPNNETCHMISETIKDIVSQRETTFEFYRDELEAQPQFSNFTDWCGTFPISQKKQETRDSKSIICYVKAAVVLYRKPLDTDILSRKGIVVDDINGVLKSDMPPNDPVKVLVRLYVIQGFEIHPPVNLNKPNAFLVVSTPLQTFGNSSTHIRQEANPCFGRSFELELEFPVEYELTVTVMNYDTVRANELIGFTKIDLENRFYSKHRARCGLQTRYETHGYNQWRDQRTPSEILKILCDENNLPEPRYFLNCVSVGGCNFYGSSDHIDELALIALLQWENIPVVGRKLVREHVETRQLYHPNFPGIPRGSIEMWVDIFESNDTSPLPHSLMTDISPRMPIEYELRVIIWSTTKVKPRTGDPAFFGKKQCDIYVKGRLVGDSNEQNTDIHIRSVGFGNFNWRFIFQFHYLLSEESRIQDEHKGKCLLACNKGYSNKLPAIFNVQIWSKERTRSDFLIGSNSMELCNMVQGQLKWWQCNKESVWSASKDRINLFDMKKNRGWWPVYDTRKRKITPKKIITGYVEMEFHLITKEEAIRSPVGLGRREPEPLDAPTRKKLNIISFTFAVAIHNFLENIYSNKFKTLCFILLILLIIFIILCFISVPSALIKKLLKI